MENENKEEVEELAKVMYEVCCYPDPTPFNNIALDDKNVWMYRASIVLDKLKTRTPTQARELDIELVAKELHWIEGINSNPELRERAWEICHEKEEYRDKAKRLCSKFSQPKSTERGVDRDDL